MERTNLHESAQPIFLSNGGAKRSLGSFEKYVRNNFGIRIVEMPSGAWAIEVIFDGDAESYAVVSTPGVPRLWRNLGGAILFVNENCPNVSEVLVDVMNWRLRRMATRLDPSSTLGTCLS